MPDDSLLVEKKSALRRKILGVKIRHARNRAGLSPKEAAQALGISAEQVSDIEFGRRDVSLPQLEVMAVIFGVPLVYFWSEEGIETPDLDFPAQEVMVLRNRIIGALLRQARTEAGRSEEDLAHLLNVPAERILDYEFGKTEIPLIELEILADHLNVSLDYFVDQTVAKDASNGQGTSLDEIDQFSQLPEEMREFISNPANVLYINIAMKLSKLSAETLRALAEGLLEVTY